MGEQPANLTLYLDTEQPIELSDFLGAFTSVGNQLERYARSTYDGAKVETTTYVKEVRHGSVEADLTTTIIVAYGVAVTSLDQALILEDFVRRWGYRITSLVKGDKAGQPDTKRDLADFANGWRRSLPIPSHRTGWRPLRLRMASARFVRPFASLTPTRSPACWRSRTGGAN